MSVTIRKYCDTCQEETVHVEENQERGFFEECLACGWRNWKDDIEKDIQQKGFEAEKKRWKTNRDSEINQEIVKELNPSEKATWFKIVNWTNKRFGFSPKDSPWKKEQEEQNKAPFSYQPYLIGGSIGAGIIAFIWLIVTLARRRD